MKRGKMNVKSRLADEPVVTTATVAALIGAVIALLVSYGVPVTDEQKEAILTVTTIGLPMLVVVARRWTVPLSRFLRHEDDREPTHRADV